MLLFKRNRKPWGWTRWVYVARQDYFLLNEALMAHLDNMKSHKLVLSNQKHNGTAVAEQVMWCRSRAANIGRDAYSWSSVSHSHPVMYETAVLPARSPLLKGWWKPPGMWWTWCTLDGVDVLAFQNQTSGSVAGDKLVLTLVTRRPLAGTKLLKSCNRSSLTGIEKKKQYANSHLIGPYFLCLL